MAANQTNREARIKTPLGEDILFISDMTVNEELGRLFSIDLELLSDKEDIKFEDLLGQNVTIEIDLINDETTYFNGYISSFSQLGNIGANAVYQATVHPWFWFLTRTADCRIFQEMTVPDIVKEVFRDLAPLALAMTLFALTEAVSIARSISIRSGQPIEGNQEFIGQGLSNLFGSFFSSYVATGSFNRSGANYDAGARTPLAAILAGLLLIAIVPLVGPLTAYLPKAAVAGLLILVAWRLINIEEIGKILKADKNDAVVLGVTFFGTIFFDLEFAILAGVILSLMIFLRKTSRPRLTSRVPNPDAASRKFTFSRSKPECPQLKILRLDDSLYFGSVSHVGELLRRYREHYPEQKHLLLLTKGVSQVDVPGAELLVGEARERRKMGGDFYMHSFRDSAAKIFERGGYPEKIGEANIFDSKGEAIATIFSRLDKSICAKCENRIFVECQSIDKSG